VQQQPVLSYELMAYQTLILILHPTFTGSEELLYKNILRGIKCCPSKKNIAGKKIMSQKVEEDSYEQYNQPEEIETGVQNSNLLLTSDHEYIDPYEIPAWGGLVVYLNTIMKWPHEPAAPEHTINLEGTH
jgi:hypothetical protein